MATTICAQMQYASMFVSTAVTETNYVPFIDH
jgi:hypothetical protein